MQPMFIYDHVFSFWLDVRLKKFAQEKQTLKKDVQHLQQQLVEAKSQRKSGSLNGPLGDDDYEDAQSKCTCLFSKHFIGKWIWFNFVSPPQKPGEANKQIADYKYKLQKAEQEIASLQASLARSETQVIRYKGSAEEAEKSESELKLERRKLQREVSET